MFWVSGLKYADTPCFAITYYSGRRKWGGARPPNNIYGGGRISF